MSSDAIEKQALVGRLVADLRTAKVELLSAQCAADRLRLRYSPQDLNLSRRAPDPGASYRFGACTQPLFFPD